MAEKSPKERFATLTEREREVLLLVCQHVGQQEIADEFVLSINTIKRHVFNIHNKLGLHDHKKTERVLALHNFFLPMFSKEDKSEDNVEKIEKKINSSTLEEIKEDIGTLRNNEAGTMIIKTLSPVVVDDFNYVPELGRFVFEKNMITCAGGIITHTKER